MKIEIVTHCWAEKFHHYANALHYQLSSLVLWAPKRCGVAVTICLTPSDRSVWNTILRFRHLLDIKTIELPIDHLGRRSIGRNRAAKETDADVVWFSDVDQMYRGDCLDRLDRMYWGSGIVMMYPRKIQIHKNHAIGDSILMYPSTVPIDVDPNDFVEKYYRNAIGGVQIVRGDFARRFGYLNGMKKWQTPVSKPFGDFRDDLAYRRFCLGYGNIVGVDLPGVYRLRHSTTTYQ